MADSARHKRVRRGRVGVYHCWNRCVRRAFLCGRDPFTGQDFSHRRDLILNREEQLAKLFAIVDVNSILLGEDYLAPLHWDKSRQSSFEAMKKGSGARGGGVGGS